MTFEEFLEQAWKDHGDRPEEVATRLASAGATMTSAVHVAELARIIAHVLGEHLGRWADAQRLLASLLAHPLCASDATAISAVRVSGAALALAHGNHGDNAGEPALEPGGLIRALASASAISGGRGDLRRAQTLFERALACANATGAVPAACFRPLAVAGNNLACALGELDVRSAEQDRGMTDAALASRRYWQLAGTWLQVERAEYVLAKTYLKVQRADDAQCHAARCLQVCEENAAPEFELFFAWEVLARAAAARGDTEGLASARSKAHGHFNALSAEDQSACAADLKALQALAAVSA